MAQQLLRNVNVSGADGFENGTGWLFIAISHISIDNVFGYRSLTYDDQENLMKEMPAMTLK